MKLLFLVNLIFVGCATMARHEIPTYSQGQEVSYKEDFKLKIGEAYWTNQINYQIADANFLVVDMSIISMRKQTATLTPPVFTLVNEQGYEYEVSDRGIAGGGPDDNFIYKLTVDRLSPLVPIKGKVVFDVPKGNYIMIVSAGEKGEARGKIYRGKDLYKFKLLPVN
ncbi:MAG: hypothetical protein HZC48_01105 [Nitrospirae bacterium]|nr:hypothetical protein [Nitrospirota bacterium]